MSTNAKKLVQHLLRPDPRSRIGSRDISEVKRHPWFRGIQWEYFLDKKYQSFCHRLKNNVIRERVNLSSVESEAEFEFELSNFTY